MLAFNNSNNFVGLVHIQATQCMTNSNFHRVCLLPACYGLGRVQHSLASCSPSLSSLHSPLHHRCKDRDHWERQQENKSLTFSSSLSIVFSDSSGRLSAMRKKKEPKRLRISIRQRMAVMVMLLCFPPKGFSLNLKEKRWKVWFKSTRLTWRCGATPPRSILNLQKVERCCWMECIWFISECWALAGLSNHNIFGKAKRRDF